MQTKPQTTRQRGGDTYAEQLREWAHALAAAKGEVVHPVLAAGSLPLHVKMFTDGNLDKRFLKLQRQLEFVAEAFEGFDDLLVAYIRELPLAAYDTGSSDGERFLQWLQRNRELTAEQHDHVACQRARHAVEAAARGNRRGHVRFQELASVAEQLAEELETNDALQVHLNPIRVWARFATAALLDEDAAPPADVLFFPVGNAVSTAVLEPSGRALVDELAEIGPCTVQSWGVRSEHADRDEIVALCRDLAEMGLVAFS